MFIFADGARGKSRIKVGNWEVIFLINIPSLFSTDCLYLTLLVCCERGVGLLSRGYLVREGGGVRGG